MNKEKVDGGISAPRLLLSAADYYKAAKQLDINLYHPKNFLLLFSIELGLKAFLRAYGISENSLKNRKEYGHDLRKCFVKEKNLGLSFEGIETLEYYINFYKQKYNDRELQYIDEGLCSFPGEETHVHIQNSVKNLLVKIYPQCNKSFSFQEAVLLHHQQTFKEELEA